MLGYPPADPGILIAYVVLSTWRERETLDLLRERRWHVGRLWFTGIVGVAVALLGPAGAMAADISSTYQVNPAHTGVQRGDPLTPPLVQLWSRDLGGYATYAVTGGRRVFVISSTTAWSTLSALDGATGRRLWGPVDLGGEATNAGVPADPTAAGAWLAYDGSRVYVTTNSGLLEVFSATTGKRRWVVHAPGRTRFVWVPVVHGGVVYTQIESDSRYDGVYAYRAGDGKRLWRSLVGIVNNGAALYGSTVYYSSECNQALAISTITHATAWGHREACTGGGGGFPVIGDGFEWIRNWGPVADEALNTGDGSVARTIHSDAPPVIDGTLAITRNASTLTGEDATSGYARWSFTGDGHLTGNAIAANGVVYIGSSQGTLFGVSEQTGKQIWSGALGAPVHDWDDPRANLGMFGGPALGGGLLLIPAGTRLVAFRSADQKPPAPLRPVPRSPITYGPTTRTLDATSYQIGAEHGGRQPRPLARPLQMVWRKRLPGTIGYPLIAGGRVFAASDTGLAAPTVKAFNLRTGALLWTHTLAAADTGFVGLAYDHGRIMAQTWSGHMYAYAAATGRGLWHERLPENFEGFEAYQFDTAPVAQNGLVYTVGEGFAGIVYAVHDKTGKIAWRQSVNWASQGAPAVTPRSLIISYGALTRAYALTTGAVRWTTPHGDNGTGVPPSIHAGAVYVTDKDFYNRLVSLAHGAQLDQSYSSSTTPAFDGGLKLVLADNLLEAENSRTGTIRWRFSGDGGLVTTPLIVGHRAFVGSSSGVLYALNDHTGRVTWKTKEPAPFLPSNARYSTGTSTLTGLNAGDGYLAVPAGDTLTVYR